jgi:hypothetical protein
VNEQLRTVLFFAHECAPYNRAESTVGAQRPAQFAKHLPEFGWRAVVICRDVKRRGRARPDALGEVEREAAERLAGAAPEASVVIPTPSLPWDGALDRMWRALAPEAGVGRLAASARKPLTVAKLRTGDYSQNWQPCARAAARAVAASARVDVCVGEHTPDAGLFLARWCSGRYGVPWVADFRDPILQPFRPVARRLYAPVARRLVSTASHTVSVNAFWASLDRELFGLPAASVPNGFDPDEFPRSVERAGDGVTVAYLGNIIGNQDLTIFLKGMALARERLGAASRKLRFLYRGLMSDPVSRLTREAGVEDMADVGGRVDREEALREQCRADLLLLLSIARPEREDVYYTRGIYPAKVFEYFGAGRPVLCVPGDQGLLDELIAETRTGSILQSPAEVAEFLTAAVLAREGGRDVPYRPDADAVARFTRRALAGRFANVLDRALGAGAAPAVRADVPSRVGVSR